MSDDVIKSNRKLRLKGIENFLRRIAFNLGNSPSETDVKIISCIPIDVSDLQQKIIVLEKQLAEAKNTKTENNPVVQTVVCRPGPSGNCIACSHTGDTRQSAINENEDCCSPNNGSTISVVCSTEPMTCNKPAYCAIDSCETNNFKTNSEEFHDECHIKNKLFKKIKKKNTPSKKNKIKTHLVYYAQTNNNYLPFNNNNVTPHYFNKNYKKSDCSTNGSYFVDMIKKQYEPRPVIDDFSDAGYFSSPICRDIEASVPTFSRYESDVCSCCNGQFHNIDNNINHKHHGVTDPTMNSFREEINRGTYNDSSLYDVVPVKEKPTKLKKNAECIKTTKMKTGFNIMYHPDNTREKTKLRPLLINHQTVMPTRVKSPVMFAKNMSARNEITRLSPKRYPPILDKMARDRLIPKRNNIALTPFNETDESSKSCSIDCGNVYMKHVNKNCKLKTNAKVKSISPYTAEINNTLTTYKNAESLTVSVHNTECQTTTTQSVQIGNDYVDDTKTEQTLNQIKSILQSVLTEVKTNTQAKNTSQEKVKKDAVVQKGSFQGNMPGSTLLNSFSYSPYNMDSYIASCSRQMMSSQFPGLPYSSIKCMHNFPVFIQTQGRHLCTGCYRNSSHIAKPNQERRAATTATNTDNKDMQNNETEKLIKEIYKSIALNVDVPTKDTSTSEYDDLKSMIKSEYTTDKNLDSSGFTRKAVPRSIFMKSRENNTSVTAFTSNTFNSKVESRTMSMQSQLANTTDTDRRMKRMDRIGNILTSRNTQESIESTINESSEFKEVSNSMESAQSEAEPEPSSDEAETDDARTVQGSPKKKEKKNIFQKMFRSVKIFKSKNKKEPVLQEERSDEESENDSDYQTIYSQEVRRVRPVIVQKRSRRMAHSKISPSKQMRDWNQEVIRRPYMEQEYRRQWDERLMFHDQQRRYSSEQPYYNNTSRASSDRHRYWQNYEARSAMVERNVPVFPKNLSGHRGNMPRARNLSKEDKTAKGMAWLKKHKLGIHCGEQWKKLILEG